MPKYVIDLSCGHQRRFTLRKKPRFLVPSEGAWSLCWCEPCQRNQKVHDVRTAGGSAADSQV